MHPKNLKIRRGAGTLSLLAWTLALVLAGLVVTAFPASAHTREEVGPYLFVIGWEAEPVIVGERNALTLWISEGEEPVVGVEGDLRITVFYGGRSYIGQLEPTEVPGQYLAEIFPTRRGQYNVQITGKIGDTEIDTFMEPEEVLPGDVLQFPEVQPDIGVLKSDLDALDARLATSQTIAIAGLAAGILGIAAGAAALLLSRKKNDT